jgi:hypothetical protein
MLQSLRSELASALALLSSLYIDYFYNILPFFLGNRGKWWPDIGFKDCLSAEQLWNWLWCGHQACCMCLKQQAAAGCIVLIGTTFVIIRKIKRKRENY